MVAHIVTAVLQSDAPCQQTVMDFVKFADAAASELGVLAEDQMLFARVSVCHAAMQTDVYGFRV